ncbi:uncharacterized protein LOC127138147 [Lathyrus oleraceus]|uniref:uncharacterized protein LOC127138147 n=1 Tax=Pisum sativum TaxID=3888 RepID=UPI0021CF8A3A|nr:uncharacterized protein LOC127138147 [Pisum sativum]
MGIPDDEILDVAPLSVIPGANIDLNQPIAIDASDVVCSNQGNTSSIPSSSTPSANSKEDKHYTDRVIRDLVTRILNEGKTVSEKGKFVASKTVNASHSEKHDEANVVIDLEDCSSEDQEESLLHHIKPSVAKRMKTHKGKFVAELMSARKAKKTDGIGPSKSWSKVEVKKRKVKDDSEPEEDVEEDVPDISPMKKPTVRKSPVKVPAVHLDNISFHLEDECYEGLVKEFIVNIPKDISDKNNKEFCKVFVRGRKTQGAGELEVTDNEVCKEITARKMKGWPVKTHLPAGKLTVKYAILHKIGVANWVPTNHISTIANTLGSEAANYLSLYDLWNYLESTSCLEQVEGENIEHANDSHEEEVEAHTSSERTANNDDASGNSVSGADEEAASSSSTE